MTEEDALDWAFEQRPGNATAKLVLVTLARHARDGWSCVLSQRDIAEATDQSPASVGRALKLLEARYLVRREARRDEMGHRTSDRYHLLASRSLTDRLPSRQIANQEDCQVGDLQTCSDQQEPPTRQNAYLANCESQRSTPTEYSLFPSPTGKGGAGGNRTSSSTKKTDEHPAFAEWYAAYPVHKARGAAVKAYAKAAAKTAPEVLLAAAKRYADDDQVRRGYGKHPATWLNQECWLDEPARAPGPAATGTDGIPGYGPRADVNHIDWSKGGPTL